MTAELRAPLFPPTFGHSPNRNRSTGAVSIPAYDPIFLMTKSRSAFVPNLIAFMGLTLVGFLYAEHLGHDYVTQWDEVVHINVVHNLFHNPRVPVLHTEELGTDYRDWTNNYVWLHKPLLPFIFASPSTRSSARTW